MRVSVERSFSHFSSAKGKAMNTAIPAMIAGSATTEALSKAQPIRIAMSLTY